MSDEILNGAVADTALDPPHRARTVSSGGCYSQAVLAGAAPM